MRQRLASAQALLAIHTRGRRIGLSSVEMRERAQPGQCLCTIDSMPGLLSAVSDAQCKKG